MEELPTKPDLKQFELHRVIGTGSLSRVRLATQMATSRHYALKKHSKAQAMKLKRVDHILRERAILSEVSHPFIVQMCNSFHDERYVYLLLEYIAGGEFGTHLRNAGRLSNDTACFYAAHITDVFEYLHDKNIIYRDLKPENVLMRPDGYLKLIDFNCAKVVELRTYTLCGSVEYIAPEVLLNKGHGKPVDWWTLGIFIYEMVVGLPPFCDEDPMGIYQKILSGKLVFPKHVDRKCKSLLKKLITADLGQRYGNLVAGAGDVKQHRWFESIEWESLLAEQIEAPFRPVVTSETDTNHFANYPESNCDAPCVETEQDPFANW